MKDNKTAQKAARQKLLGSLDTASRIYVPARYMCVQDYDSFQNTDYHPTIAAKIVGLAFLAALTAWEDFVGESFLGYLCGYKAPNGYTPKLRSSPAANRSHALRIITGEIELRSAERKTRWSSMNWVQNLANIHFKAGNPYSRIPSTVVRHLEYATKIRNRVAHNSQNARSQFKVAANQLFSRSPKTPLGPGYSPGQLLISDAPHTFPSHELDDVIFQWGDCFEAYISLFAEQSEEIVPHS